MKTKRRTEIIFETHEITKVRFGGSETETSFEEAAPSPTEAAPPNDSRLVKRGDGFKARLREKLRRLWGRNRRPR